MTAGSAVVPDRLRASRDIADVLRAPDRRAGRFVVVHARRRDDEGVARLAYVASKRVGGAVQRNRAKRLLREAARGLDWAPGTDVVLVARASAASSDLRHVADDLEDRAQDLGVLAA